MNSETTLTALLITALLTGIVHTVTGPDHYLPFIAISRSRHYGLCKTLFWTFLCGLGHIGSALLLALGFLLFAKLLSQAHLQWLEQWRGNIAAYALIGMGAAMLVYALHCRWRGKPRQHVHVHADGSVHRHSHAPARLHDMQEKSLSYWVLFIIFVLGPCEALFPLLTASAVLGTMSVLLVTALFSIATISTMLAMVTIGTLGLNSLHFPWLEEYTSEIAGGTVMACGLAIVCLGL